MTLFGLLYAQCRLQQISKQNKVSIHCLGGSTARESVWLRHVLLLSPLLGKSTML